MAKIDREWLRRIPGYRENPVPGLLKDEQGRPFAPSPPDEEDLPPGEADGDETEEPGTGMENAPIEPPPLSVPDEVESERQEKEERERFSRLNLSLAPKAFELEGRYIRVLASRFARMVSKVAEDSADMPVQGDEEWDMAELLQRRFTGRMVSQCRMTREKRKVAVVLDTSLLRASGPAVCLGGPGGGGTGAVWPHESRRTGQGGGQAGAGHVRTCPQPRVRRGGAAARSDRDAPPPGFRRPRDSGRLRRGK